ncbi:MAG: hypothetical protein D6677_07065 [Calditrichaeota bacterium]|nr:MAG: hypothetical protein D6677_07065 [Calditrichota bacterium]
MSDGCPVSRPQGPAFTGTERIFVSADGELIVSYGKHVKSGSMKPPKEKQLSVDDHPLAAWFLGPKGEHSEIWSHLLGYIFQDYVYWRRNYFPQDPIVIDRLRRRRHEPWFDYMTSNLDNVLNDLKAHFPFYSPRYIAHMLSEQTLPGVLGYFAGMLYNPNNVTDEAAPVTVRLELEVGRMIAGMIGYKPEKSWAHITSGGTVANIEALWIARMAQFVPLIVREFCQKENIAFTIKTANREARDIRDVATHTLLHLPADRSIKLVKILARYLIKEKGWPEDEALTRINRHIHDSRFNPGRRGYFRLYEAVGCTPRIYVSATAHYSIAKAVNLLGYGEDHIVPVPINKYFRMDTDVLRDLLTEQPDNAYTAGVVAVMGTTEEGAVDAIHEIHNLRMELETRHNRSFWLHADAAWGGYVKSLFCGHDALEGAPLPRSEEAIRTFLDVLKMREDVELPLSDPQKETLSATLRWEEPELVKAYMHMSCANSVTIDPHKMGYIPYPAGIVSFRNGLVTELIAHKAQYISDIDEGIKSMDESGPIHAIGPYILEGSKPGAAAAACWLSHKTIPLKTHGHGKIIRTGLLNARKLDFYLRQHRRMFTLIEAEIHEFQKYSDGVARPFSFFPLYTPDTNIVCFIAAPVRDVPGTADIDPVALNELNRLNNQIYHHLTISGVDVGYKPPYGQPYFVSRTRFEQEQYAFASLKPVLEPFGIPEADYKRDGLFVLRSTVMNPFYYLSEQEGKNYLLDFVKFLHLTTRMVVNKMYGKRGSEVF